VKRKRVTQQLTVGWVKRKRNPTAIGVGFRKLQLERWQTLTRKQQETFPPICPDFVIELRSRTDSIKPLQEKMQEYLDSGLRLGWLINDQQKRVEIYRRDRAVEIVNLPNRLSGENVLPGFILDL